MTKICAVITDPEEIPEAAAAGAGALEFRLDLFKKIPDDLSFVRQKQVTIVTFRGKSDEERRAIFARALAAGADYVDIEDDSILRSAFPGQTICSHHDFAKTPDTREILRILREAAEFGIPKAAFFVRGLRDLLALAAAADEMKKTGRPFILIGMGEAGKITRVRASQLGSMLNYCALRPDAATAPGQLTLTEAVRLGTRPQVFGITGWPLEKTFSPQIHGAAIAAASIAGLYVKLPAAADELPLLPGIMRLYDIAGMNVTIPHKQAVVPTLAKLTPAAAAIGAVNTITRALCGANTDWLGVQAALAPHNPAGKNVLLIGAGGAARAAAYYLNSAGAHLFVTNRTAAHAETLAAEFGGTAVPTDAVRPEYAIVINASPVCPLAPEQIFSPETVAMDMVYPDSAFLAAARAAGCAFVLSGKTMLLHQAAESFALWTGIRPDIQRMEKAFEESK
ncbi:MAG: type I 3-dehydroquinate dehydratase [Methanocorpusculum sp.]|nr:type I 3-dehydroquinate dehydratase [Methanocorpusculum sp.]